MNTLSDIKNHDHARIQEEDFNLIRDTAKGVYVEVGTFHGASAYAASQNADKVWTIDIYSWEPHIWHELGCRNVQFFMGTSVDICPNIDLVVGGIDVLFIDGSHEFDSVKKDIESLEPLVKKGGIIMFHDYRENSSGVWDAVQEYLKREKPEIVKEPTKGSSILVCKKQ